MFGDQKANVVVLGLHDTEEELCAAGTRRAGSMFVGLASVKVWLGRKAFATRAFGIWIAGTTPPRCSMHARPCIKSVRNAVKPHRPFKYEEYKQA
jgi:hypothetical protein